MVAIASATSKRTVGSAGFGAPVTARSGRERPEVAADELEDTPIDRLVGIVRMLCHERGEKRRELVVTGPQGAGDEQLPIRQPDEDPACAAELLGEMQADLGQKDSGGVAALPGLGR